jgi:hypothetical protein
MIVRLYGQVDVTLATGFREHAQAGAAPAAAIAASLQAALEQVPVPVRRFAYSTGTRLHQAANRRCTWRTQSSARLLNEVCRAQAHSLLDSMRDELAEGQRSLLALAAEQGSAGSGSAAAEPVADPTIELAALLHDRRWV